MAIILKHRRGTLDQLRTFAGLKAGELGVSTGSITGITGPLIHVGDTDAGSFGYLVGRLQHGNTPPTASEMYEDMLFYDEDDNRMLRIGATSVEVLDFSGNIASISASLNNLEATASDHETRITNEEATSSDHETRLANEEATSSDHETRITTNEGDIVLLEATASDHETRLVNEEATSSDHETRIDALETLTSSLWTGSSEGYIQRESNVQVTGAMDLSGNLTVGGIITAQEFHTEVVSASIIFESGSTKFGNSSDDTHEFTGSVSISGSGLSHTGDNPALRVYSNAATEIIRVGRFGSTVTEIGQIRINSGSDLQVLLQASESSFFVGQNVGIGTNSPDADLHVVGDSIHGSTLSNRHQFTGSFEQTGSGGTSYFLDVVGIGTNAPLAGITFDVHGSTKIGEQSTDRHEVTGSVDVSGTGSFGYLDISGDIAVDDLVVNGTGSFNGPVDVTGDISVTGTVDGVDISTFSSSVASEVDQLQASASDHETRIDNVELTASRNEATASDHETRIDNLESTASSVDTRIVNLESTASDHETRLTNEEATSSDHETRITTNEGDIVLLEATASDHETRLANEEATSSDHETRLVNEEATSSDHETRIDNVELTASRNEATASAHEARLDAIDASGSTGLGLWTGSGDYISRDGDVQVTGSINVSGTGSFGYLDISGDIAVDDLTVNGTASLNGPVIVTDDVDITGDITITGTVDGVDISVFSGSVATEIDNLEATASDHETRLANEEATSSDHETRITNVESTASQNVATASDHETRIDNLEATASAADTRLTNLESTASDHETRLANEEATSSDHETRITTNEGDIVLLQATASDHETRIAQNESDIVRLDATASAHETRLDNIDASGSTGLGLWTGSSNDVITRDSDVEITGALNVDGDVTVTGIITAQEFHTEFVSSSIIYDSGSTKFGDTLDDRHEFTGSLFATGNLDVTGTGSFGYLTFGGTDISAFSSSVSTRVTDLESTASDHETRLTNEEATSSDHETRITTNEGDIVLLEATASDHEARLILEEATSSDHETRLVNEEATSSDHETRITTNEGDIVLLEATASDHEGRLILEEATSSAHEARLDAIDASGSTGLGLWTGSGDYISREGNTQVTGNLDVSGTGSFGYINLTGDIAVDDLTVNGTASFNGPTLANFISASDLDVAGDITVGGTVDGVDISVFSSSVATEIDNLEATASDHETRLANEEATSSDHETRITQNEADIVRLDATASAHETRLDNIDASGSTGLGFWTGSGANVSRTSDVLVTGSLIASGSGHTIYGDMTVRNGVIFFDVDSDGASFNVPVTMSALTASSIDVDSFTVNGTTTVDMVLQSGSGDMIFIAQPTASDALLNYSASEYVWVETIDGGFFE